MSDLARYLDRTPNLHVCGVKLIAGDEFIRYRYRAWFKDGWKGEERISLRQAVEDMESEMRHRIGDVAYMEK